MVQSCSNYSRDCYLKAGISRLVCQALRASQVGEARKLPQNQNECCCSCRRKRGEKQTRQSVNPEGVGTGALCDPLAASRGIHISGESMGGDEAGVEPHLSHAALPRRLSRAKSGDAACAAEFPSPT